MQKIRIFYVALGICILTSTSTDSFACLPAQSFSCVRLFATLTVAHQAPQSLGFSRQEYWVGCHVFFQGIFSTQGSNPRLLSLLYCRRILCLEPLRKPIHLYQFSSVSSIAQSCLTLCDPMNRSTPGLPVHHKLPEFTQTHAHQVSDAIQPSHPL